MASFDTYLLGYRKREPLIAAPYVKRINRGGGMVRPALLVNGRVIGTWRLKRGRARLEVTVEPFETLPAAVLPGLESEAAEVGRFLGGEALVKVAKAG